MDINKKKKLIIFITVLIDLIGFGIVIPLHPYLAREFGADPVMVGVLMSIYSLMQFIFAPFWGKISDHKGRRPVLLISLTGAAVSYLFFALSTSFWALLASRALAGFFSANISTAMAAMADISDEKDRSKTMGLIGAAFGIGFTIGPFLGALFIKIGNTLGDAPPFTESFAATMAFVICFLNALAAYKYFSETKKISNHKQEKRSRLKKLVQSFKLPVFKELLLVQLFYALAMANLELPLFLYVKEELGLSIFVASLGFAYIGLMLTITQGYFIRKLIPKKGEAWTLMFGLIVSAISLSLIPLNTSLTYLAVVIGFLAIGLGSVSTTVNSSISLTSKPEEQGQMMGVSQSLSALGRIIGPILSGYLIKVSYAFCFYLGGFFMLLGLIIVLRKRHSLPSTGKA